jgi:uncharacterized protein
MTNVLKHYFFKSNQSTKMLDAIYEVKQKLHTHEGIYHFYYVKILERLDVDQSHIHLIMEQLEKGYEKKDPYAMMLYAMYLNKEKLSFYQPVIAYQVFIEAQPLFIKKKHARDPFALHLQGTFLFQGLFMKPDPNQALTLFLEAAKGELLESYDTLFQLYQKKGVFENQKLSETYLNEGMHSGDALLLFKKGLIYLSKKEELEAMDVLQKSSDLDLSHASFALANIYIKQKQHDQAFLLMEKAASLDHPHALYMLSLAYANGKGTFKDIDKSRFYLEKAAQMHHVVSMNQLAMTLMRETPKDHRRIYELLNKASLRKDPLATYNLAMMYFLGDGLYQNQPKAFQLLDQIKHTQLPMVLYQMGVMLVEGRGTNKNETLGINYLKQAAEKRFNLALEYLKKMNLEQKNILMA